MTQVNFTAVAERRGSAVHISFSDVPGLEFEAGSVIDGFEMAPGVLQAYIDRQAAAGRAIPLPSPPDPDRFPGDARFIVPVELPFEIVSVTLNVSASLLKRIDAADPNRSMFFARAAEAYLKRATRSRQLAALTSPPSSRPLEAAVQ